jgi:hypothetical protein
MTKCYGKSIWNLPKDELLRFLDEDLASKVEGEGARVILDEVPEDGIEIIEQWKNQNPEVLGGTEVSIKPTSSGLTAEEEEENRKILFSELPCDRPRVAKARVTVLENLANSSEAPEEWKPRRFSAQLKWWKKSLEEAEALDQRNAEELQRKNEYDDESEKTRKAHQNIGKGKRKHRNPLNAVLDRVDQYFKEDFRVLTYGEFAIKLKNLYKKTEEWEKFDPDRVIIDLEDENASIRWKKPNGEEGKPAAWSGLEKRLDRIRKARIQLISATGGLIPEKS